MTRVILRSNPIEIGGTTVRFYTSFFDASTTAEKAGRVHGCPHRAVHVNPFGWVIENVSSQTFCDQEGRLPDVTMRLLLQRMKTPA